MVKGKRGNGNRRGGKSKSVRRIFRNPNLAGKRQRQSLSTFFRRPKPEEKWRRELPNPFLKFMLPHAEAPKSKKTRKEKKSIWERRIEQYAGKTLAWHKTKRAELLSDIDRLFDQENQLYARLTGMAKYNGGMSVHFVQLFQKYAVCFVQHKQARQHFLANAMHLHEAEHGRMKAPERRRFILEIKHEFAGEESFLHLIHNTPALVHEARETFESLRKS